MKFYLKSPPFFTNMKKDYASELRSGGSLAPRAQMQTIADWSTHTIDNCNGEQESADSMVSRFVNRAFHDFSSHRDPAGQLEGKLLPGERLDHAGQGWKANCFQMGGK